MLKKIEIRQGKNRILLANNEFYRWDPIKKKWIKINIKNKKYDRS